MKMRGVRIFDVSDPSNPKLVANVQNCRGSHTHTLVEDLKDKENIYIYTSGTSGARPQTELEGCQGAPPPEGLDAGNQFSYVDVIKVPLAHPEQAAIVNHARIFDGMTAAGRGHGNPPGDTAGRGRGGARGGGAGGGRGGAAQAILGLSRTGHSSQRFIGRYRQSHRIGSGSAERRRR